MKLFTTILLMVFATGFAQASIEPQDITVQRDVTSGTVVFRSTVAFSEAGLFKLTDDFGNVVFSDSVAKGDFINNRFKTDLFAAGKYEMEITDRTGKTILPININAKEDIVNLEKAKHLVYPTMNFSAERTLVVAYNNKSGQRLNVKIANDKGETVFTDQVTGPEDAYRAYQLDRLQSGTYQLIVSSRDVKNHTTDFALR